MSYFGQVLTFILLLVPSFSQAGLYDLCDYLFQTKFTQSEHVIRAASRNELKFQDLKNFSIRSDDSLKLDARVARELSSKGFLKELGITLVAKDISLKAGLLNEIENRVLLKIKLARNLDEFLDILTILKRHDPHHFKYSSMLSPSPFVKRELLGVDEIKMFLEGRRTANELKDVLSVKAAKAFKDTTSVKELMGLLRVAKRAGIDQILPSGFLQRNPLIQNGLLDARLIEQASEKEVKSVVFASLLDYSKKANSFSEYFELVDAIKFSDFNGDEMKALLGPMTKLGGEFGNIPLLIDGLKKSIQSGKLDVNNYVGKRLKTALEIMYTNLDGASMANLMESVDSGLSFSLAVSRLGRMDSLSVDLCETLARSPFATKYGIDAEMIKRSTRSLMSDGDYNLSQVQKEISSQRPGLVLDRKLLSLDSYDSSVNVISIKDQCNLGACWVHSPIEKYEIELSAKLQRPVELSTDYLYFHYLKDEYKRVIRQPNASYDLVSEGGFSAMASQIIENYGIVPRKYIPEGAIVPEAIDGFDMQLFNREKITEIKNAMKGIFEQKEIYARRIPGDTEEMFRYFDEQIENMMSIHYQTPPNLHFNFGGELHTPESFTEKYLFDVISSDYGRVQNSASKHKVPSTTRKTFRLNDREVIIEVATEEKKLKEINSIIKSSIDQQKPVQASFHWPSSATYGDTKKLYVDSKTGLMTSPHKLDEEFIQNMNKLGGHAVLIVGYEVSATGDIISYKILNSWGRASGDNGIYHMEKNFFDNFLKYIDVNKKTGLGFIPFKNDPNFTPTMITRIRPHR